MPVSKKLFDPKDLKPLTAFVADGTLRLHPNTAQRFARQGKLPAVKIGHTWLSTHAAIRSFCWKQGNGEFRNLSE
jgi:hypothetical protein